MNDRDNRPSLKTVNITFANLNRSSEAFTELMLARSRDSIIFTCETPVIDYVPPNAPGYYLIYNETPPGDPPPPSNRIYQELSH